MSEGEEYRPVNPALTEAVDHAMGDPETWGVRELGYRLRAWSGRIVNGLQLVREGKGNRGVRWRVRAVKTAAGPRTAGEEWDGRIKAWLDRQPPDGEWSKREILQEALGYDPKEIGQSELTRKGYCLRRLGLIARHARVDGRQSRVWRRRGH